jgi:hypothetical protein
MEDKNYTQLCVMTGTLLPEGGGEELEQFFKNEMNVQVKFSEQVDTLPDTDGNGNPVPETGGRSDLFFYIHNDDIMKFALPRLSMGISWWEDVVGNGNHKIYPQEIQDKYPKTW